METSGDAAPRPRSDTAEEVTSAGRLSAALVASSIAHALAILLALSPWSRAVTRPPLVTIPVSLVALPGGGEGGGPPGTGSVGGGEPPAAAVEPSPAPVPTHPEPAPRPTPAKPAAHPKPAPRAVPRPVAPAAAPAPDATVASSGASGGGTPESGNGDGGGGGAGLDGAPGGDGSGGARVAYGTNPLPPYPMLARRLGMEGVVLLDVLVAPDGQAAEVHVARSSGFPALDESALTTVRQHWRFVPARRSGTPVASRVTVPIRFRLDGES